MYAPPPHCRTSQVLELLLEFVKESPSTGSWMQNGGNANLKVDWSQFSSFVARRLEVHMDTDTHICICVYMYVYMCACVSRVCSFAARRMEVQVNTDIYAYMYM